MGQPDCAGYLRCFEATTCHCCAVTVRSCDISSLLHKPLPCLTYKVFILGCRDRMGYASA